MAHFIKLNDDNIVNTDYIYQIKRCKNDEHGFNALIIDDDNNRFYTRYTVEELLAQLASH